MQDQISLQDFLQSGAKGCDELGRQVGNEPHGVGQKKRAAFRKFNPAQRWIKRREQHVFCEHASPREGVEKRRFPRVRIADEGNHLLLRQLPAFAVQPPCALDDGKVAANHIDAFADSAAVRLDLRLARAAQKAETAPLTFKVRPGPDKPAFLIGETRQLDLQPAFLALRPVCEDFQNEPGTVEHLRVPRFLEIALLDRA